LIVFSSNAVWFASQRLDLYDYYISAFRFFVTIFFVFFFPASNPEKHQSYSRFAAFLPTPSSNRLAGIKVYIFNCRFMFRGSNPLH
jgi:hypothetical protein